tara:strand:+ start:833 stop:1207 length:375 start_codon:yes stop_codon:yes gene_type:complete
MYITDIRDEAIEQLSISQYNVVKVLEERGKSWGIWIHDGIVGDRADEENYEGGTSYWRLTSSASFYQIRLCMNEVGKRVSKHYLCSHEHDCCGCWFFAGISVALEDDMGEVSTYIISESYGRNV